MFAQGFTDIRKYSKSADKNLKLEFRLRKRQKQNLGIKTQMECNT